MATLADLRVLASGLDHPEGIATGPDGLLYAGGEAGQVYRIDPESGSAEEIANTGGFVLGVCLDAAGTIYVCDAGRPGILRIDPATGAVSDYCTTADGGPLETPNWAAFAPDGTLWFTDSGTEALDIRNGRLIRVGPGGGDGRALDLGPLHFPNGMCVDADGTAFFLETFTPRLVRVTSHGATEVVADLPGTSPDGVALTADGGFLVSCYYPFRLIRVAPDGATETALDDPTGIHIPMPTNVAFFGEGLSSVAIASLGGMVVKAIDLGLAGAPLNYPQI
jgi:gluconolactonase